MNNAKYRPFCNGNSLAISRYEIRLAIEAISVPRPPRFVPMIRERIFSVNPESRIAAGTLLVTCEASTETHTSWPVRICCSHPEKAAKRPRLPIKIKSVTKVRISE